MGAGIGAPGITGPAKVAVTFSIPSMPFNTSVTATASAVGVKTIVGCPWPHGKDSSNFYWPITESGRCVKLSLNGIPSVSSVVAKPAKIDSIKPVLTQTRLG